MRTNYFKKNTTPLLFSLGTAFATSLLIGCGTDSHQPDSVAKDFLMAIDSRDTATALALATPESAVGIRLIMSVLPAADSKTAKHLQLDKLSCAVTGKTALCTYCCDANGREQQVNLQEKDEKWQVSLKKDVPSFAPSELKTPPPKDSLPQ